MTKEDIMWIAIRLFGLYFLVLAVAAVPSVVGFGYGIYHLDQLQGTPGTENLVNSFTVMLKASLAEGVSAAAQFLVFSLFSYYFLRKGKGLHAAIMS